MDESEARGTKRSVDELGDEALVDTASVKRARLDLDPALLPPSDSNIQPVEIPIVVEEKSPIPPKGVASQVPSNSESRFSIAIESDSASGEEPSTKEKASPKRQRSTLKERTRPLEVIDLDDSVDEDVERTERLADSKDPDFSQSRARGDPLADIRALSAQRYQQHKLSELVSDTRSRTRSSGRLDDVQEAIRRSLSDRHPTNAEREAAELTNPPIASASNIHTLASLQGDNSTSSSTKPYSFRVTKIDSPNMAYDSFAAQQLKSDLKNIRNQEKPIGFVARLNFTMSVEKVRSLFGKNWLSDEVINTYISAVVERALGTSMAYLESYWCSQILKHGPNGVTKWHQTGDLLRRLQSGDVEYVFAPVNFDDSHWCLCLLAPRKKTWYIIDSAGHEEWMRASEFAQIMQLWLDERAGGPWKLEIPITQLNAHQDFKYDSYNCGVYVCLYAEWLCSGRSLDYVVNTRVGTAGITNYRDAILMALFRDIPLSLEYKE